MGEHTAIGWTDHTFNPWWGCAKVSPACNNCYAEAFAKRTGNKVWGKTADRRFLSDKHWAEPFKWDRAAQQAGRPALVFCASMADVFEDRPDLIKPRQRLFELIEATPHLIWQLLTKRPENVNRMVPHEWVLWPNNVWIGTTAENQRYAHERIPELLKIAAPVRFLSCEPLLAHIGFYDDWMAKKATDRDPGSVGRVDWIICGGESGPGHRPMNIAHARSLRNQAELHQIPFFFKQWGGQHPTSGGDLLDGRTHKQFPDRAGRS